MTEIMIETAEQEFLKNNYASAFKWASLAKLLDPFYGSVDIYVEAYRIHFASIKKTSTGEMDLYGVLGIEEPFSSVSCELITHKFVRLAKMINPENHHSAAAPGALKLITNAWEILGESDTRRSYDIPVGLLAPSQPLKKRGNAVSLAPSQPVTKKTESGSLLVSPQTVKGRESAGFLAPSRPAMKTRGRAVGQRVSRGIETSKYSLTTYG